jgi:hypothetical protein
LLKQLAISKSLSNKIVFTDYYPTRDCFFSLCLHYYEDTPIVYDALGEIMELILNFIKDNKVFEKQKYQSFMNDLNWISAGKLKSLPLNNHGISLGLLLVNNNQITAFRYGRMLLGKISANKLEYIGPEWNNFSVKSLDRLSLLGLLSEDKFPEIYQIELQNKEKFVMLESDVEEDFRKSLKDGTSFSPHDKVYQILECHRKETRKKILGII